MSSDSALMRLLSLSFQGACSYRDPVENIPLAKQGIVLIAGQEGAGKSTVPEVATLILQGKGSPRVRTTGLAESSIVNKTTGYYGTLEFESGIGSAKRHVEITQAFKHKLLKSKYVIKVDGKMEEPDGKPEQRKLVKRLAPLSMGEWLGVVYLSQGANHDLLMATPTGKREYLTSVFGLDFYDDLVNTSKAEMKALIAKVSDIEALQQRAADLAEEQRETEEILSSAPNKDEVEELIEKLSKRMQRYSSSIGKLESSRSAARKFVSLKEKASALSEDIGANEDALDDLVAANKIARGKLATKLSDDKAKLKSIQSAERVFRKAEERAAKAKARLDHRKTKLVLLENTLKGAPKLEALEDLKKLVIRGSGLLGPGTLLEQAISVSSAGHEWKEFKKASDANTVLVKKLDKLIAKDISTCPTCDQTVEQDVLVKTVKTLKDQVIKDRAAAERGFTECVLLIDTSWQDFEIDTIIDLDDYVLRLISAYEDTEEVQESIKEAEIAHKEAVADLKDTTRPQDPEKLLERVSEAEEKLEELEDVEAGYSRLSVLYGKLDAISDAQEIDIESVEADIEETSEKRDRAQGKYTKQMQVKSEIDQAEATARSLEKQVLRVDKELMLHADKALKIKHYEDTLTPYFESLRAAKVHSCVSVLEGVLPVYVAAMSADQYQGAEIRLNISDDLKKVDMQLKAGRYSDWVSALQASGGQRRGFSLSIIAALREVSPRKANVMFFDEPFADLEGQRKLLFVNKLLPLLMDRCEDLESVFVIAHDQEILETSNDTFDSVWMATRDATGSHLQIGQKLAMVEGK